MAVGGRLLRRPYDAVFQPSEIVRARGGRDAASRWTQFKLFVRLLVVFSGNLLLYTLPLSLAGIGAVGADVTAPAWFADLVGGFTPDVDATWRFSLRLAQNSVFLLVAGLLTFVGFHTGATLTGRATGVLRSLRVVTYSTALYLATIFTLVWYASTAPTIEVADDLLIALQSEFIYYFIDSLGSNLQLPGGRPGAVDYGALTTRGQTVLGALLLAVCYYAYVLYVGARASHGMSRFTAMIVVAFVAATPAIYVVGSILAIEIGFGLPEVIFA